MLVQERKGPRLFCLSHRGKKPTQPEPKPSRRKRRLLPAWGRRAPVRRRRQRRALPIGILGGARPQSFGGDGIVVPAGETLAGDPQKKSPPGPPSVKKTQAPPAEIVTVKRMPRALSVPRAAYPEPARRRGLQGEIQLSVTVGTDGAVLDVELKKGIDPELDALAIDALRRARFAPAVGSDGKPMRYTIVYRYVFRLEDES